ncbi:hypothetical protein MauCBS54593_007863 [Microsporum audouinii]
MEASVGMAYARTQVFQWMKVIKKKVPDLEVPQKNDYLSKYNKSLCRQLVRARLFDRMAYLTLLQTAGVSPPGEPTAQRAAASGQAVFVVAALHLVGIDARIFHSGLSTQERDQLVHTFTTDRDSTMVLVITYNIGSTGLNLQHLCHHAILFDCPPNEALRVQAISRFHRVDQRFVVLVEELRVQGTFNTRLVLNRLSKAIPSMVAELNKESFIVKEALGSWGSMWFADYFG